MNFLKKLFNEIVEESNKDFPVVPGYKNLNMSKSKHHRRIAHMIFGNNKLTAVEYSDMGFGTKLVSRINELEEEYGYPLIREKLEGRDRWYYRYSLDFNKLKEMTK